MADPQAIVDAITAGDYDGDLGSLFEALFARATETETSFGWKLKLDDDEWSIESVTIAELGFAEHALSTGRQQVSYLDLDPLRSMEHCAALIVAHLHKAQGLPIPEAFKRAEALTVSDLKDIVSVYEVKAPKVDGGGTSTTS